MPNIPLAEKIAKLNKMRDDLKQPNLDTQSREELRARKIRLQIEVEEETEEIDAEFNKEVGLNDDGDDGDDWDLSKREELYDDGDDGDDYVGPGNKDYGPLEDYDDCSHDLDNEEE